MSETRVCRERLAPFCEGDGVDLGFGGDKIIPSAIAIDLPQPYTHVGDDTQNLGGDATDLKWFRDGVLDYVYSSHLLEDFPEDRTATILTEWFRVLKIGGKLVIFCPVEQVYRAHCKRTGQDYNLAHSVDNFSVDYVKQKLVEAGLKFTVLHEISLIDTYSFDLVVQKDA